MKNASLLLFFYMFFFVNILAACINPELNAILEEQKLNTVFISNNTNDVTRLTVTHIYHPRFDEEDFSLNTALTTIFEQNCRVISTGNGTAYTDPNNLTHVTMLPYREMSRETAIILENIIEINRNAKRIKIGSLGPSSYIGGLSLEDPSKNLLHEVGTGLSLTIDYYFPHAMEIFSNNLQDLSNRSLSNPICKHFFKEVTPSYSTLFPPSLGVSDRSKKLLDKFKVIHGAGVRAIRTIRDSFVNRIPLIHHTFLIGNVEDIPLGEVQRNCVLESIDSLSISSGWKHMIWTNKDPVRVQEDLRIAGGIVEIINIETVDLEDLTLIQNLIRGGKYDHATIFLKYNVLSKFGGLARGINYKVLKNLSLLNSAMNFYANLKQSIPLVSTDFFAAHPKHPIIERALFIARYHHNARPHQIKYLQSLKKNFRENGHEECLFRYGDSPLTLAFYQFAMPELDMLFDANLHIQSLNSSQSFENYASEYIEN